MRTPSCSLILSTYELPKHLELVLTALERQTFKDFEILIADDGSGNETKQVIQDFIQKKTLHITHLWQEHHGFRKCKILNQALQKAAGDYLIFLDGDCIPHKDYIKDHFENKNSNYFLAGRRVELGEKISQTLNAEKIKQGYFDFPRVDLIISGLKGDSEHINRTIRITNPKLRETLKMNRIDDMKGCNYSVHKNALIQINGFDEDYEGYGREDTDVELRLKNLGLKIKSMKGLALQYHLWHPRRGFTPANDVKLELVKKNNLIQCQNGLKKL